jgi:formate dehydrogenase iron-sulfur subunit
MKKMAILTDVTKCIGCEKCVAACKETNHTGEDRAWRWQTTADALSASRWTTIIRPDADHFVRQQCRHCLEPACVSVCPVQALRKTPEGPVVYNSKICMGCRYCMMACPYGVPRYLWEENVPVVRKCVMCYDKITQGSLNQPACTKACPTQATIYGERDALLVEAHQRLLQQPDRYPIQKVWGEFEVGGTSVLLISPIDLGFLSWKPQLGDLSLPRKTWGTLRTVPYTFGGVGLAMFGIHWIIGRRIELKEKNAHPASESDKSPTDPVSGEKK